MKQLFLELFRTGVADPNITETGPRSTSSTKVRRGKADRDFGSLTKKQEKKDSQVFPQKPNSGF